MHFFLKVVRPVDRAIESPFGLLPSMWVFLLWWLRGQSKYKVLVDIAHLPGPNQTGPETWKTPKVICHLVFSCSEHLTRTLDYIKSLYHHTSLCDVCMERIRGEWFRCVYCAKDLCRDHEAMDTHNPTHLFIVFKSSVSTHFIDRDVASMIVLLRSTWHSIGTF